MSGDISQIYAIFAVVAMGVISGFARYFKDFKSDLPETPKPSWRRCLANVFSAMLTTLIVFFALNSSGWDFWVKIALASGISFFGVDKALDYAIKLKQLGALK